MIDTKNKIDYLTVAYINYDLIFLQIENFKKRLNRESYRFIVVDNTPPSAKNLDEIEKLMNEITPLVSNAKNDTIELYGGNAGSYDITQPIEIVKNYLREIKELLTEK